MTNSHPPTFEVAYRDYRGLLFAAFGQMARQGFVVSPSDANDIVHDFFADAWNGLEKRYEPQRASFSTYMYAAFVRFARPRIVRLHRLNGLLREPAEIARLAETVVSDEKAADEIVDLARMQDSIDELPKVLQYALRQWLDVSGLSERDVARILNISRYELRRRLVDALGHVSVAMGGLRDANSTDKAVALAVWRDGLTMHEAAGVLGMTLQETRNACLRNERRVQQSIAMMRTTATAPTRRTEMPPLPIDPLLQQVLHNPLDDQTLGEIEANADQFLSRLAQSAGALPADSWEDQPPEKMAQIYFALSRGLIGREDNLISADPLVEAAADDQRAVGRAFADALVPALPNVASLQRLAMMLSRTVEPLRGDALQALQREQDVVSATDAVQSVVQYGLRPTHFVYASDAIGLLLQRAVSAEYFPQGSPLRVEREGDLVHRIHAARRGAALGRDSLVEEVATMADLPMEVANPMLDWMMSAAPAVRLLFDGFSASYEGPDVVLTPNPWSVVRPNLIERWSPA